MSEQLPPTIAPLRNVAGLIGLIEKVQNRHYGLPGMATFYGPSGFGKSTAITVAANEFQAYAVQVKSVWSPKHFCQAILGELSLKAKSLTISEMVDMIGGELARFDRPLLIDDAQYLHKKSMIDLTRDIYESSGTTIILVGEEQLPNTLSKWENVHNRMLDWLPAQPCDIPDARHLAKIYAAGVTVSDDLITAIVDASAGSIRRVAVNLARVREIAQSRGRDAMSLGDWGDRAFETGQPPAARRPADLARPVRLRRAV